MRLAVLEQQCCAFFSFVIHVDQDGVTLEVTAPAAVMDAVTALFGDG